MIMAGFHHLRVAEMTKEEAVKKISELIQKVNSDLKEIKNIVDDHDLNLSEHDFPTVLFPDDLRHPELDIEWVCSWEL